MANNYSSKGKLIVVDTDYSTSNYPPDDDSTSSGGSGSPQDAWSTPAQRGRHFPSHIPQSTSSTSPIYAPSPYTPSFSYSPGYNNSTSSFYSTPSTPVAFVYAIPADTSKVKPVVARPDSWESRREALEMLARTYRDSIGVKDN